MFQQKKHIYFKIVGLFLLAFLFSQCLNVTQTEALTVIKNGDFRLHATNQLDSENKPFIKLKWDPVSNVTGYKIWQKEDGKTSFEQKSANYGKKIKVLNVYPDHEPSNNLKTWMDNVEAGLGLIEVTPVKITDFNNDPDSYLIDGSGQYMYDVVMFGSWDVNANKDLTEKSATSLRKYMNTGRGVLFGHDTIYIIHPFFASFAKDVGIRLVSFDAGVDMHGSAAVKVIDNGYLMKYPHELANSVRLEIPMAHSTLQLVTKNKSRGETVWIKFIRHAIEWYKPYETASESNNFYLVTKNNVGLIQTGHSGGQSTFDEQRILANTLFNLAQHTLENEAEDRSVMDKKEPDKPVLTINNSSTTLDETLIDFSAKDNGTNYEWYVEANTKSTTKKSDTVSEFVTSGTKGFIYVVDKNKDTAVDAIKDEFGYVQNINATIDSPTIKVDGLTQAEQWIHIRAVDYANNVGPTEHIQIKDILKTFRITEKFQDEKGNILKNDSYQDISKNEKYENAQSKSLPNNWKLTGYKIGDKFYPETAATIAKVVNHETITFIYRKVAIFHLKQVIIEPSEELTIPLEGHFQFYNTKEENLNDVNSVTNAITKSGDISNEPAYKAIKLFPAIGYYHYQIEPIVPSYYAYIGYQVTTTDSSHSPETMVKGQKLYLKFEQEETYWITIYLKPTEIHPQIYSWDYRNNEFGKIQP